LLTRTAKAIYPQASSKAIMAITHSADDTLPQLVSKKVQSEIRTQLVRTEVRTEETLRTEREIIEGAAAVTVIVVREHHGIIGRGRNLVSQLKEISEPSFRRAGLQNS
jgi:hypothetical protein